MATRQRGCAAKKASTCSRRSFLRNRIAPEALAACAWNTFLARSNPIVLTSVTDASLKVAVNTTTLAPRCRRGASTPSLTSACTAPRTLRPWRSPSTAGRERPWAGEHRPRLWTSSSEQLTQAVLRRPLESTHYTSLKWHVLGIEDLGYHPG